MDIWDTMKVMVRRWYVVVPVGVLCAFATINFSSSVEGEYVAGGVAWVKGPEVQEIIVQGETQIEARNPYLGTGGTDTFARILIESVSSSGARQEFVDRGFAPAYDLALDRSEAIIDIEVRADDPQLAVQSVGELLAMLAETAEERQLSVDGLDAANLISVEVLSQTEAGLDNAAPRRVMGVLAAASIIVIVGSAFLVEGIVRHVRGERPSWYAEPPQTQAAPAGPAPLSVAAVEYDRRPQPAPRRSRREIEAVDDRDTDDSDGDDDSSEDSGRWRRRTSASR